MLDLTFIVFSTFSRLANKERRLRQAKLSQQRFVTSTALTCISMISRLEAKSHFYLWLCAWRAYMFRWRAKRQTNRCDVSVGERQSVRVYLHLICRPVWRSRPHTICVQYHWRRPRLFLSRENRHRRTSMKLTHCSHALIAFPPRFMARFYGPFHCLRQLHAVSRSSTHDQQTLWEVEFVS